MSLFKKAKLFLNFISNNLLNIALTFYFPPLLAIGTVHYNIRIL